MTSREDDKSVLVRKDLRVSAVSRRLTEGIFMSSDIQPPCSVNCDKKVSQRPLYTYGGVVDSASSVPLSERDNVPCSLLVSQGGLAERIPREAGAEPEPDTMVDPRRES